jgi:hypothetical protein
MSVLKNALKEVRSKIKDLSEVEVRTYTGEATAVIAAIGGDDAAFDNVLTRLDADDSEVHLAYLSRLDLDGDAVFFRATGAPADLADAHRAAVESGIQSRAAIINLFKDLLNWGSDD